MPTIEEEFGKGLLDRPGDPRDTRDFRQEEIAAAFKPATWIEKKPEEFATYPIKDQKSSSSCVGQSFAKQLEVDELAENGVYRLLSPRSIYSLGFIADGGGMNIRDAAKLITKVGATLETLLPSESLGEIEMRKNSDYKADARQVALVYKPDSVVFSDANFEAIASIIETFRSDGKRKVVGIAVEGWNNGTWISDFPQPVHKGTTWHHKTVATDFGLINGKKFISIDNSWGVDVGRLGQQFLGIDYEPFIYSADYTINLPDNWQALTKTIPKPSYRWDKDLVVGFVGIDVLKLQEALQYLGMFPIDQLIKPTGAFYGITRKAVMLYQEFFGLPVTGIVDSLTRHKLNQDFT